MRHQDILPRLEDLIIKFYKAPEQDVLKEDNVMRPVTLDKTGVRCLLYSFDKKYKKGQSPNRLFTFFNTITGAQVMCDYCLFGVKKGNLYILLFELKKGDDQVMEQLKAGEEFAKFIVGSLNRINNWDIKPKVRRISVRASKVLTKPTTRISPVKYDESNLYTFDGYTIDVSACMI